MVDSNGQAVPVERLRKLVECYEFFEQEEAPCHQVYFDRNPATSGLFSKIDTNHGASVPSIVSKLVTDPGFIGHPLRGFFETVDELLRKKKFTDDFDKIALEAPELPEDVVYSSFAHIGYSTSQKNVGTSLQRILDLDEVVYHAMADVREGPYRFLYLLSKQQASYKHDENTCKQMDVGEKPLKREYLVMMKCLVQPTTISSEGHVLGKITGLRDAYCVLCKAGGSG